MAFDPDCKYLASWYDEDPRFSSPADAIQNGHSTVWIFWDGSVPEDKLPPRRVQMLSTGLIYTWEEFQKVQSHNG